VQLALLRHGLTEHVRLATANAQGTPEIGVQLVESYVFPFPVTITIGNIGGPSAGLIFALGIIDKITPDNLTGGRFIAGTGEIEANGTVDPIGGVPQKQVRAPAGRAAVLLAPAAHRPHPPHTAP